MTSARSFQHVLAIMWDWWRCGLMVNGQYALTDDGTYRLLRYCSAYASKCEAQQRGTAHLHVSMWHWPAPYVLLTRVSTLPPDTFANEGLEGDAVAVD